MGIPFSKEILSAVFVCLLFQPGLPAQASVSDETTTITLDHPVHFLGTDGSDIVADSGDYSVADVSKFKKYISRWKSIPFEKIGYMKGTGNVKSGTIAVQRDN